MWNEDCITAHTKKSDVLLFANVFEKFRNSSLKNCGLYWTHYLSPPVLSCN